MNVKKSKGLWVQNNYRKLIKKNKVLLFFQIYNLSELNKLKFDLNLDFIFLLKNKLFLKNFIGSKLYFLSGSLLICFTSLQNLKSCYLKLRKYRVEYIGLFLEKIGVSSISNFLMFLDYDIKACYLTLISLCLIFLKQFFNFLNVGLLFFRFLFFLKKKLY